MRIAFMRISPAWVGDQFGEKYTDLILLDAWAEQTPLLGKGGVDAPSRDIPVPLIGADGVVRSNSKQFLLNEPPRLRPLRWLRDILLMGAATPPFPRRGIRFKPTLSTTKCVYFPGFVPVLGTSEDSGTQSYTCWA